MANSEFTSVLAQDSAFGLFARKLEARTDNGELMNLIDDSGCPINELVFPALDLEKVGFVLGRSSTSPAKQYYRAR